MVYFPDLQVVTIEYLLREPATHQCLPRHRDESASRFKFRLMVAFFNAKVDRVWTLQDASDAPWYFVAEFMDVFSIMESRNVDILGVDEGVCL